MSTKILAQNEHPLTEGTKLVVSHGTWRKRDYVDVRVHWQSPDGEWFPTKKGVRLGPDLARQLTDNIRQMLGVTEPPQNGNGDTPESSPTIPQPDMSVFSVIRETAEYLHVAQVSENKVHRRNAAADFGAKMSLHFQPPDHPYTAYFEPLARPKIDTQIAKIRAGSKPRRHPLGEWFGYGWNMVTIATAQHPNHGPHRHGASYCKECQPQGPTRIRAIADRAQKCIDTGIDRSPLPEEAFAWRRSLDAQYKQTADAHRKRYGAKVA